MTEEDYNIDDGNDPLREFIDVDVTKMTKAELSNYLSKLNEAAENPKAVKRIVSKNPRKTVVVDTANLLKQLGL